MTAAVRVARMRWWSAVAAWALWMLTMLGLAAALWMDRLLRQAGPIWSSSPRVAGSRR